MSEIQKEYLDYLPPLFSNVREFRALAEVIDNAIRHAYDDIAAMCDAPFIKYANDSWRAMKMSSVLHQNLQTRMP